MVRAKIFQSGRSEAVRLPKEFRFNLLASNWRCVFLVLAPSFVQCGLLFNAATSHAVTRTIFR